MIDNYVHRIEQNGRSYRINVSSNSREADDIERYHCVLMRTITNNLCMWGNHKNMATNFKVILKNSLKWVTLL